MYTLRMAKRVLFETNKRLLWKLIWNMGVKGSLSVMKHRSRMKKGQFFPPFLYVSIILWDRGWRTIHASGTL